jgi:5-deoxy-glucuronate isomerase
MNLLVKARRETGEIVRVTPESAGWRFVGFSAYQLPAGESVTVALPGREVCVVVLAGRAHVQVDATT